MSSHYILALVSSILILSSSASMLGDALSSLDAARGLEDALSQKMALRLQDVVARNSMLVVMPCVGCSQLSIP